MKTNAFLANMAKAAFAFAATLMLSMTFTACSGDDEEVNPNIMVIDNVERQVFKAELIVGEENYYELYLYLSEDGKKTVTIEANTLLHNGKTIDLTKQETDEWNSSTWIVGWREGYVLKFHATSKKTERLFKTGTMKTNANLSTGDVEVTIVNGKVQIEEGDWGDGLEHTISLYWKGKARIVVD